MNPKLIALGVVGLVILSLTTWGFYERSEKLSIKADYDGFIAKAQILAAEQLAYNRNKEIQYAERLKTAEFAAAAARNRLREYTERPRSDPLPGSPQTADANTVCFATERLDRGLRELEGIIVAGQEAVVDRNVLLESWPK